MKKVFLSLIAILFIASCSKKDDIVPDLAAQVVGTYQVTSIMYEGQTVALSKDGVSADLKLSRIDDVSVKVLYTIYSAGKIFDQTNFNLNLVKSIDRILLKDGSADFGYIEDKKFVFDVTEKGLRTRVEASR